VSTAARPDSLPNPTPRPAGELEQLERLWSPPPGLRFLTVINNNYIGILYLGAAFLFFILAGVLALIMRTQLAVPNNDWIGPALYNQLFTMHGTMMMFLFAVPAVEAMGVLLLPNMVGARDLPFPRLSAYAFWAYLVGGLVFFSSIFFGMAPDAGWFLYPPLSSHAYSPGINQEFWLLGIGFIEISAIAGAIEIIVGVLRTRAPGMSLAKMPLFAWAMLIFALLIIFAFPAVILATTLLELERAFGLPFFVAEKGGDPLLWQHLFWFFGHPEVYIIFLPAAGIVSMIVPAMTKTPLAGFRWVVLALITTGFLSFGLWVHHMFTTGIPTVSLSFFQAASMAVAIPSGIQFFAWIATFAQGRARICTPTLFILGFLAIFLLGGLTGVMVAVVPFDWQVHDTYFIVAHLHYVLIGGMVFPLLAGLYYWMPYTSRHALSERCGRWVFGLVFVGFNVAFFPMHITGLAGMPRRVHTYADGLGWNSLNMVSTVGAFVLAAGLLLLVIDVARRFRFATDDNAGNVWNAGTLEWLPTGTYGNRSIPIVASRYPLWDDPNLARDVEAGAYYLPGPATGWRETIVTSIVDARPQYVLRLPCPGWAPFAAALFTAAFFLLLTFKLVIPAVLAGLVAIAAMIHWAWSLDPPLDHGPVDIGGGIRLPVYCSGPDSHAWWAMVILMLVSGSLYGCLVFSYLYLWTVSPQLWASSAPPGAGIAPALALTALSSLFVAYANRQLARRDRCYALVLAIPLLVAGVCFGFDSVAGWSPRAHAYAAAVYTLLGVNAFFAAVVVLMALYVLARQLGGHVDRHRRVSFDNARIFWHYAVAQSAAGLLLIYGFPRLVH
jgi:cytochrome c oxidase subunit I+III